MPLDERQARHKALLARIRVSSARHFCQRFLDLLNRPPAALPAGKSVAELAGAGR